MVTALRAAAGSWNFELNSIVLSRSQRLTTGDFAVVFEKGRVLRHPLLQLRIHRREAEVSPTQNRETGNHAARAAFVVPKKLGKAAWRNRVRRRVRERYRILTSGASGKKELQACDLVFLINAQSETASPAQIDDAMTQLLRRAVKAIEST